MQLFVGFFELWEVSCVTAMGQNEVQTHKALFFIIHSFKDSHKLKLSFCRTYIWNVARKSQILLLVIDCSAAVKHYCKFAGRKAPCHYYVEVTLCRCCCKKIAQRYSTLQRPWPSQLFELFGHPTQKQWALIWNWTPLTWLAAPRGVQMGWDRVSIILTLY